MMCIGLLLTLVSIVNTINFLSPDKNYRLDSIVGSLAIQFGMFMVAAILSAFPVFGKIVLLILAGYIGTHVPGMSISLWCTAIGTILIFIGAESQGNTSN